MNPDIFAEWARRQGLRVYASVSIQWIAAGPQILQSFPYDEETRPAQDELRSLFKTSKAIALRYSTPCSAPEGKISYHVVFEGHELKYETLPKKVRHDIQHGLDYCQYRPVSLAMLGDQGWPLREETLIRQKRQGAETQAWWSRLCASAEGLPGFEAWGAMKDGRLVASIFTYTNGGTASILYQQSLTAHLKYGVNNTLAFSFVNDTLKKKKASRIFYGLHSLDAPPSVDEFKFRMGFRAKPVRQRVVFNPIVAPIFNRATHAGIKVAHQLFPGNYSLAKAEGMLHFYRQGKLPLSEQEWPGVLLEQKDEIISRLSQP